MNTGGDARVSGAGAIDRLHASCAIELARHSQGNTRVGAIIAKQDRVLSSGFKGERVGLHAEQVALEKANELDVEVRDAVLYTTLEPCANSRTSRVPCCELISRAGISTVHIGEYDPNPRVYRLGWKYLRDQGVVLRDFPADLRALAHEVNTDFTSVFTQGIGESAGAKFDFTQNGGKFTISVDDTDDSPAWETRWSNCGPSAIYLNGGHPGVVAHARYAEQFGEIDDPDALDYGGHFVKLDIGSIGAMRNEFGHVLCRVMAIEPTLDYGGDGHTSVKILWEVRLRGE